MIAANMQDIVQLFEKQEYHQYLGLKVIVCSEGVCQLQIPICTRIVNLVGTVHGGVIYSLCAIASSLAALSKLEAGQYTVANDFNISVLRGVASGLMTVNARVLKSGRRLVFVEITVNDQEGILVASGRVTKSILP